MQFSRRQFLKAFAFGAAGLLLPSQLVDAEPIKRYWQGATLPQPRTYGYVPGKYGELPYGMADQVVGIALSGSFTLPHFEFGSKQMPVSMRTHGLITGPGFMEYPDVDGPINAGDIVALGTDGKLRRADPSSLTPLRGMGW